MKTVLTIAGSDSSGGAGIQADIKTMISNGVYAMSAVTALTAQNTTGVAAILSSPPEFLAQQLDCVFSDIFPDAVKIGMVSEKALIETIAQKLTQYKAKNIVLDPVMVSTSGARLINENAADTLKGKLFAIAEIVTPNIPEAEVLTGIKISDKKSMEMAAFNIFEKYGCAVLCKGGHSNDNADDVLCADGKLRWFIGKRINNPNTHGTGCTLSSAIASNLAKGYGVEEAVERAKMYVSGALASMLDLGRGSGPMDHGFEIAGVFGKRYKGTTDYMHHPRHSQAAPVAPTYGYTPTPQSGPDCLAAGTSNQRKPLLRLSAKNESISVSERLKMPRCIIFSAGTYYGLPFALNTDDFIICADAGLLYCKSEMLTPDITVGDFDSMPDPQANCDIIRLPVEKDDTDTMAAVKIGFERGCTEFHLLGATGGARPDHTIANIQSLAYIAKRGGHGFIYDKNYTYTVIHNEAITVKREADRKNISVFCIGDRAEGVTLTGVKYPVCGGVFDMTFPLGVSNCITEDKAVISVQSGYLLVCTERL
ncbi:MAG: bifunctional hydroxymethylpyrimidine kinase/phosphomethylpyrimidine kinase [Synergistes sp.]|nr:bifunctional hydroxymethylpyrimidine kinase/phosphomethylpyrimidine kinase [Synergistes sp.]